MGLLNRGKSPQKRNTDEPLTQQELGFLLKTLSECKFEGKDVILLSSVVEKLSSSFEEA